MRFTLVRPMSESDAVVYIGEDRRRSIARTSHHSRSRLLRSTASCRFTR